jgi:rhamnose utilization protein RhaD (predicted bifunctional aldolase and dehydrogenase)
MPTPLEDLVALSRNLGDPALDAVILGEGNTSIAVDERTFLVKGSGCQLASITTNDFVLLRRDRVLALLDRGQVPAAELDAVYDAAKVDRGQPRRPSVEALFHAVCLAQPGVSVVAHTHPTAVNAITCSQRYPAALAGRMFPDEAVVLGPESVYVPYVDPGVPLAAAILAGLNEFRASYGQPPKCVYMQNHGLIALAATPTEAMSITAMAIKAARIRLAALSSGGGITTLPTAVVAYLISRPDEKYRAQQLTGQRA